MIVVAAFLGLGALLVAIPFLINLRDERLLPEVSAALGARHDAVPPSENLFFAVLAFDMRNSSDINADGQRLYANYLEGLRRSPNAPLTLANDPAFPRQEFVGDRNELCGVGGGPEDCIERTLANPQAVQRLLADNASLIDRYQSLQAYRRFEDRLHPSQSSPVIHWTPYLLAKRSFLTSIALDYAQGRVAAALARLQGDVAFTRRILAEPEELLIDKVVMAASLRLSLTLASDILRHGPLSDADYAALREVAAPLTVPERSLAGVLQREFEPLATMLASLDDPKNISRRMGVMRTRGPGENRTWSAAEDRISLHFFKLNATLNDIWLARESTRRASEGSCRDWQAGGMGLAGTGPALIRYVYNPIGKALAWAAAPAVYSAVGTYCDLEAMQRIVALQVAFHSGHIAVEDAAGFIARTAQEFFDPYTGRPFLWDAAAKGVTFQPALERNRPWVPWPL